MRMRMCVCVSAVFDEKERKLWYNKKSSDFVLAKTTDSKNHKEHAFAFSGFDMGFFLQTLTHTHSHHSHTKHIHTFIHLG